MDTQTKWCQLLAFISSTTIYYAYYMYTEAIYVYIYTVCYSHWEQSCILMHGRASSPYWSLSPWHWLLPLPPCCWLGRCTPLNPLPPLHSALERPKPPLQEAAHLSATGNWDQCGLGWQPGIAGWDLHHAQVDHLEWLSQQHQQGYSPYLDSEGK